MAQAYGLPGKPGYEYTRPFDYFTFQGTASSANLVENVMTRGLLYGRSYEIGNDRRGIMGIYGSDDYIAPQTYRISSTALSIGTTAQAWLSKDIALQGTGLMGMGYAAVGTSHGKVEGDYHYGLAPQALLALRMIFGDKASLDVTGREYFVTSVGGKTSGRDNIIRTDLSFFWRIDKQHAVSIKYLWYRRDATYATLCARTQSRATFGIYYTCWATSNSARSLRVEPRGAALEKQSNRGTSRTAGIYYAITTLDVVFCAGRTESICVVRSLRP